VLGPGPAGLYRNRDFLRLWAAQSVTMVGTQVGAVALPLTAVLHLDAGPVGMGLLGAAAMAPYLGFSLLAGVWVDRLPRRLVLVVVDLTRAALLALVPVLFLLDALSTGRLLAVALLVGTCAMVSDLAHPAYLPSLVAPGQLLVGNSRLVLSRTAAEVAGPGLAGPLVTWLTAPVSLLVVAATCLGSAAGLLTISRREPRRPRTARPGVRGELVAGIRTTLGHPVLRPAACGAASFTFCWSGIQALLALYVVQRVGLTPTQYGLCFAAGAVGAVVGSLATVPLAHRFGIGRTMVASAALSCAAPLLLPLLGSRTTAMGLLSAALFLQGLGLSGWDVQAKNLQQRLVPAALMGRMNGTYLTLSMGAGALGALGGGVLASAVGLRASLVVGAGALSVAWLWLLFSPVRRMGSPEAPVDPGGPGGSGGGPDDPATAGSLAPPSLGEPAGGGGR
jgi:MFS family permease